MQDLTETVAKFADAEQYPKMIGSQGGMDYLVIARNPETGLQLGIKTLFTQGILEGKQAMLVGFRLRCAYIPGSGGSVHGITGDEINASQVTDKKEPHEGWAFAWEQVGGSNTGDRASLVRTVALNRTPDEAKWIYDDLDHIRYFGKLQAMLHEQVSDEHWLITDDDLTDFIKASIYPSILSMAAATDPAEQLKLLELKMIKHKEHSAHFEQQYEAQKAILQAQIDAKAESGEIETYQPKAHFAEEELVPMDSVAHHMLKGAKPKLGVVGGTDVTGFQVPDQTGFDDLVASHDDVADFDPEELADSGDDD